MTGSAATVEETILLERHGKVATVTLNRPHRRNAVNRRMKDALAETWREIGADPSVRAVVVTGAGPEAFCSGADVREMAADTERATHRETYPPAVMTARQAGVFKPMITAINGVCAGGGLHFVADGDIVIASDNATFLDPHVYVGQLAALEPIGLAARGVPLGVVLRMVLLGREEPLDARRALEVGLVSEVVPQDQLAARALELAQLIASASPAAVQASLRAIWGSLSTGLDQGLRDGWELVLDHLSHPDAAEGARAFSEKRSPQWLDV